MNLDFWAGEVNLPENEHGNLLGMQFRGATLGIPKMSVMKKRRRRVDAVVVARETLLKSAAGGIFINVTVDCNSSNMRLQSNAAVTEKDNIERNAIGTLIMFLYTNTCGAACMIEFNV